MKQTAMVRSFGRVVRTCRKARGLSRPELARRCGLSYEYVKELERGNIDPNFSALGALARALEMDPDELLEQVAAYDKSARRRRLDLARIWEAVRYLRARMTTQRAEDDDERTRPTRNCNHFID
ncbi:MAG: helix-turn-helix domain-containing protein [Vicinamibacteraceae bacterium]